MRPPVRRLASLAAALALAALASPAAAEPPPPTDAELTRYIAVQKALVGDVAHRAAICSRLTEDEERDTGRGDELAAAARRVEADPIFGPQLRQQSFSGRRYVELSVQVGTVLLGAAIADDADAAERAKGRPATSRQTLLASSPAAPPILARQQDLTTALTELQAVCESSDDDGYDDEGDDESGDDG